jgi:hypothetical protein
MGTITERAQALADNANASLLSAIKDIERLEKLVCGAPNGGDLPAMIAANNVLMALRDAKRVGMEASGLFNVVTKAGGS